MIVKAKDVHHGDQDLMEWLKLHDLEPDLVREVHIGADGVFAELFKLDKGSKFCVRVGNKNSGFPAREIVHRDLRAAFPQQALLDPEYHFPQMRSKPEEATI